jgi:hypothetical protein
MQERMGAWANLTPEQRRIARENYARARKLQPDQRNAEWQQYQQLSEEEKKRLADQANTRKGVASIPSPAAQDRGKLIPPPKSVLKKELQPAHAERHPATQPHAQPAARVEPAPQPELLVPAQPAPQAPAQAQPSAAH